MIENITLITLIPITCIIIYFLIKEINYLIGQYKLSKTNNFNNIKYKIINFKEYDNKINYIIPRGQSVLITFKTIKSYKGQSQRMYTGFGTSGLKIPFLNLSSQKKKFYEKGNWLEYGSSNTTITNKVIRIDGDIFNWSYKLKELEKIIFIDNDKTVLLSFKTKSWPVKLSFKTNEESELFVNSCWTAYNIKK